MKKYSGFTLIEMLIVMGIIIILMAAGIAGGRFAIQRANRIQKQNAVENIEQAAWGYYTDYRNFPRTENQTEVAQLNPQNLLENYLEVYLDAGQFDGGIDGRFWYFVEPTRGQEMVVCAELHGDDVDVGIYCSGNGLDTLPPFEQLASLPPDNIFKPTGEFGPVYTAITGSNSSEWNGETRSW